MERPDELPSRFTLLDEDEAHQRGAREVEGATAVGFQKCGAPASALFGTEPAPVQALPRESDLVVDFLEGRGEAIPAERRAEDRMSSGHPVPSLAEGGLVERLLERADDLLEIDSGRAGVEAMEEHPLLGGGEAVCGFDRGHVRSHRGLEYFRRGAIA